jgi:hypothetical protein
MVPKTMRPPTLRVLPTRIAPELLVRGRWEAAFWVYSCTRCNQAREGLAAEAGAYLLAAID